MSMETRLLDITTTFINKHTQWQLNGNSVVCPAQAAVFTTCAPCLLHVTAS